MWKKNGLLTSAYRCRECAIGQNPAKIHPDFPGPFLPSELAEADCQTVEKLSVSFKCPFSKCKRKNLSFREFYHRLCCAGANDTLIIKNDFDEAKKVDHDFLKNLLHQHKESNGEVAEAKKEYDEAQKKFEAAKKKKQLKEDNQLKLEDQIALYFARTVSMITEGNSSKNLLS
jgi:hypothetical protein